MNESIHKFVNAKGSVGENEDYIYLYMDVEG